MVFSASFLTSSATTAKPLPASPALAASMAALSASRLVWSAISLIVPIMSPIPWAWVSISFMSFISSLAFCWTCFITSKDLVTDLEPSSVIFFVSSAPSAVWAAFLDTSNTVEFISSIAVAISAVLFPCSSTLLLTSSACAASSSAADARLEEMSMALSIVFCNFLYRVFIFVSSINTSINPMIFPCLSNIGFPVHLISNSLLFILADVSISCAFFVFNAMAHTQPSVLHFSVLNIL